VHRSSAVVHEHARGLGLRRVQQLREHVVRGHGRHQDGCPDRKARAVRRRVAAGDREREQAARQQHVQVQQGTRDADEQVRPVHQPQAADVDDRGDGGMGQDCDRPSAQEPGQRPGVSPGQRAQRERHRRGSDEQQWRDHPHEQVPHDVQPQVVRHHRRSDDSDHRHGDPHQPEHGPPRRPVLTSGPFVG